MKSLPDGQENNPVPGVWIYKQQNTEYKQIK